PKLQMASYGWPKFQDRSGQFLCEAATARLIGPRSASALPQFSLIRNMKLGQIDVATLFGTVLGIYHGLFISAIMDHPAIPFQYSLTVEENTS
ncbi:MAG TPA: hypothetical protein VGN01_00145, partial [Acidobacteriaceae bacterium]